MTRGRVTLSLFACLSVALALSLVLTSRAAAAPEAIVIGNVLLQGRSSYGGTTIYFDGTPYTLTSPSGEFALAIADGGIHTIRAKHDGYLSRSYTLIAPTSFITIPETTLFMGDADGDDDVDIADLLIVSASYGSRPPSDPRADLDGNGEVGAPDLVGVVANFNTRGPLPWADAPTPT